MNLGENIYRFRTEKHMSQGDLADALDVSRQSVSKWENNSATPELEKLIKMSELFGVTLDRLVGKDEPIPPAPESRSPEIPVRQGMPVHRVLGIILLCFGLATFLILTILGDIFVGFIFGAPLMTVGIICTICTDNLPIRCWWGVFAVISPVACLFILNMVSRAAFVFLMALLAWFMILLIWTLIDIRKGRISTGAKKMVLGCVLYISISALILGITLSPLADRRADHADVEVEASAIPIPIE